MIYISRDEDNGRNKQVCDGEVGEPKEPRCQNSLPAERVDIRGHVNPASGNKNESSISKAITGPKQDHVAPGVQAGEDVHRVNGCSKNSEDTEKPKEDINRGRLGDKGPFASEPLPQTDQYIEE